MSEYQKANEIARQLKQKRLRSNPFVGARVSLELDEMKKTLTTAEAAVALNRKQQTLRMWALDSCTNAPIKPIRICGRLAWSVSEIEALLNGEAQ